MGGREGVAGAPMQAELGLFCSWDPSRATRKQVQVIWKLFLMATREATWGQSKINFQGPECELQELPGAAVNPVRTQRKDTSDSETTKDQKCRTEPGRTASPRGKPTL